MVTEKKVCAETVCGNTAHILPTALIIIGLPLFIKVADISPSLLSTGLTGKPKVVSHDISEDLTTVFG